MQIVDHGSFRTHLLIPNDVVGAFTPDKPPVGWLSAVQDLQTTTYFRNNKSVMRVERRREAWRVTALADIWLQEPSVTVKVAGRGAWWGKRKDGKWEGPFTLKNVVDPFKNTVHFSRVRSSPRFCEFVEYREDGQRWRWRSDGGFADLINKKASPKILEACKGCYIFNQPWRLSGVFSPSWQMLRSWEASGGARLIGVPPGTTQLHLHGWAGGPGCVVNAQGKTPPPGHQLTRGDGYDLLWSPTSWRLLKAGRSIEQLIVMTTP
jgi:hypothetical protein